MQSRLSLFVLLTLSYAFSGYAESGSLPDIYGRVPLTFEANRGQSDHRVKFLARGQGYGLFLTAEEAVISLPRPKPAVVRMKLVGQRRLAEIEGLDANPGTTHYLMGSNAGTWQNDVPSYLRVRFGGVYPGIDLVYYGNQRELEYDFLVQPGGHPEAIALKFDGVESVAIDGAGELVLRTRAGELRQRKPRIYQEQAGGQVSIAGGYVMRAGRTVGFEIGDYDKSKPLVIDPVFVYSTYLGGTVTTAPGDQGNAIAIDSAGNAYVTGQTASTDFPLVAPMQGANAGQLDGFVFKLDPTGTAILYSTYFGGSNDDEAHSIAVDSAGNAYITGFTFSSNFPILNGLQRTTQGGMDAYLMKLNSSGGIIFSTYLGGSADDRAFGVALNPADPTGGVYVTGMTSSRNFPVAGAFQSNFGDGAADVFVTKFSPSGGLVYSTYVGGRGLDQAFAIAIDSAGGAYVVGFTTSINFPLVRPLQAGFAGGSDDAFIFKLSPAGNALEYSTYYGGNGSDEAVRVIVDDFGNAFFTGATASVNFPVVNAFQPAHSSSFDAASVLDAFVVKLTPDGQAIDFSTYLGGSGNDSGTGIGLDSQENVYVSGFTTSTDFPAINALQVTNLSSRTAFITKFTPDASELLFSTYLGSSGTSAAVGLAVDAAGSAYVTGFTNSGDFPVANPIQGGNAGGVDTFVARIITSDIVNSVPFLTTAQGAASVTTANNSQNPTFGFATAAAVNGPAPVGFAMISLTQLGHTVSEVAIPSTPLTQFGRFFAEVTAQARSVISIANPNDDDAGVDFFFTNDSGDSSVFVHEDIGAHSQFSVFVSDPPFSLAQGTAGTLSFSSSVPVASTAFSALTNERSETVISNMPIADQTQPLAGVVNIPHFADGGGWRTSVVLVNLSEDQINGTITFVDQGSGITPGMPVAVQVGDDVVPTYGYDIPPRSFQRIETAGSADQLTVGWIQVVPNPGTSTPQSTAVLTFVQSGITVTQVPFQGQLPQTTFRFYAETDGGNFDAGEPNSTRSAFALANPFPTPATVQLNVANLDGSPSGLTSTLQIPPDGQVAMFIHQVPGFANLPIPFRGVLTVNTTSGQGIVAGGIRGLYNEISTFLAATDGPIIENGGTPSVLVFPHTAEGGGYSTQFILLNRSAQPSFGVLGFFRQNGDALNLTIQ
jgi:hypothetical protein